MSARARHLVFVLIVSGGTLVGCRHDDPPIAGSFAGGIDRVVFSSNRDGSYDIYSSRVDGTDVRQLTDDQAPQVNHHPVFTPDGERIVWGRDKKLWIMDRDGSNAQEIVTSGPADHPWVGRDDWVYFAGMDGGHHVLARVRPDGSGEERLTDPVRESFHASLHPEEDWVLYTASPLGGTDGKEIRLLDLATRQDTVVFAPGHPVSAATWHPSGDRFIVAEKSSNTYSISAITHPGGVRTVLHASSADNVVPYYEYPAGDAFLFTVVPVGERTRDIVIARADGSDLRRLTTDAAEDLQIAGHPDAASVSGVCVRPPVGCNPKPPPCDAFLPPAVLLDARDLGGLAARTSPATPPPSSPAGFVGFARARARELLQSGDAEVRRRAQELLKSFEDTPEVAGDAARVFVNSYLNESGALDEEL